MGISMPYATCKVDSRGQRFSAAITATILLAALITLPHPAAFVFIVWQLVSFFIGVTWGPHKTPTGLLYKTVVKPKLKGPPRFENSDPPRFAQSVGLAFLTVAAVAYMTGLYTLTTMAVGAALGAATLSAVLDFCLGCQMYEFIQKRRRVTLLEQ